MKILRNTYVVLDLLIVLITFGVLHFIKFGVIFPTGVYFRLIIYFMVFWIFFSAYFKKYKSAFSTSVSQFIKIMLWSTFMTLFFITSTVSVTNLVSISRQFILLLTIIPLIVEIILINIIRFPLSKKLSQSFKDESDKNIIAQSPVNPRLVIIGASMLIIIYFILIKYKTGELYLYPWSERILLILFASWLISFSITKKYSLIKSNIIYYQITPFIKSGLIMLLTAAMLYYFFRIESLSRFLLFGTILIYTIFEIVSFLIYYSSKTGYLQELDTIEFNSTDKESLKWDIQNLDFNYELKNHTTNDNLNIKLIFDQIHSLKDKEQIVDFIENNLQGMKINFYSSSIFSTISLENIEILRNSSKNLLINLHKLNDIRRLNQYLITCYQKIIPEGILVGYVLPLDTTFHRLQTKMPKLIFTFVYPFHFLFNRVIPKIPRINRFYFFITQGKNRTISKAEMYGRLNFCGFKIENDIIINDKLFFIAKKVKTISTVTNPSYHPIVKLDRVGFKKEIITIHKFRTMHPYSEFLQKDIYEENELDATGKFKDDFRVTSWGKMMRKFWIDELPQIYDWLQGRINLVGVRAISEQYFSLYPKELQDYRTKFKPGIIPPYYVDLPQSLEEIFQSERRYLQQKEITPIRTDIKYGFTALKNIIFRGARSS